MKEFYQIFYYKKRLLLLHETAKNSEILMHNMKKQFICTSFSSMQSLSDIDFLAQTTGLKALRHCVHFLKTVKEFAQRVQQTYPTLFSI